MSTIVNLLKEGVVAAVSFGSSRHTLISTIGWAPQCLGRPPWMSANTRRLEHLETWLYDDGALGLSFNPAGLVNRVTVSPPEFQAGGYLIDYAAHFGGWTFHEILDGLTAERLHFEALEQTAGASWIVGGDFYFLFLRKGMRCSVLERFPSTDACMASLRAFRVGRK